MSNDKADLKALAEIVYQFFQAEQQAKRTIRTKLPLAMFSAEIRVA